MLNVWHFDTPSSCQYKGINIGLIPQKFNLDIRNYYYYEKISNPISICGIVHHICDK